MDVPRSSTSTSPSASPLLSTTPPSSSLSLSHTKVLLIISSSSSSSSSGITFFCFFFFFGRVAGSTGGSPHEQSPQDSEGGEDFLALPFRRWTFPLRRPPEAETGACDSSPLDGQSERTLLSTRQLQEVKRALRSLASSPYTTPNKGDAPRETKALWISSDDLQKFSPYTFPPRPITANFTLSRRFLLTLKSLAKSCKPAINGSHNSGTVPPVQVEHSINTTFSLSNESKS
mmetsp:Transcript_9428/g.14214  ORF Transcript_9428/g.14214 Transcript_9428/m.14214 type:complete len:231 (-) Transcript_9428:390-1082(-)